MSILTACWYRIEVLRYKWLVGKVKHSLQHVHPFVGEFGPIERLVS